MSGSNEGNEGNEGNSGSLGRAGGGGFGVLPDRLDLPFITEPKVAEARLAGTTWKPEAWDPAWAAWMVVTDFAQAVPLSYGGAGTPRRYIWIVSAPTANKGTIEFDRYLPLLPDAQIGGRYRLRYSDGNEPEHEKGFTLLAPGGGTLGTYDFADPAGPGSKLSITNEVNLVITRGSASFATNDAFVIAVEDLQCTVEQRLQGQGGQKGSCTLDPVTPLLRGAELGTYRLRCIAAAAGGGTFRFTRPRGTNVIASIPLPGAGSSIPVSKELSLTISPGTSDFDVGDGFDIEIRRAPWLPPPDHFQAYGRAPPIKVEDIAPLPDVGGAKKGTLRVGARLPAAYGAKCNNGLAKFGTYRIVCKVAPVPVAHGGIFEVTDPHGLHLGAIKVPRERGRPGELVNQLNFVLRSGEASFELNDAFEANVTRTGITVTRVGAVGGGLTLRPWHFVAPAGDYSLICNREATNGGSFSFSGPGGFSTTIGFSAPSANAIEHIPGPFPFDLVNGTPNFGIGDGFAISIAPEAPAMGDEVELADLIRLAEDERADALGEILAQHESFIAYFMAALGISPRTHPASCELLHIGSLLGAYVSMHFKRLYQRQRPSKRAPGLMPPIPVPGHPAYPSGHSTQAHLMALCALQGLPRGETRRSLRPVLMALAGRIARNREIAGLHYESDSRAGARLAEDIFGIMTSGSLAATDPAAIPPATPNPSTTRFEAVAAKAREEWA